MRPVLDPAYALRIQHRRAYLYRRCDDQPLGALTTAEAVVMGLCDGTRSTAELEEILYRSRGPEAVALMWALFSRLRPLLTEGIRRTPPYPLERLAQVGPPVPSDGLRPLPGPRVLHWWVTQHCARRCVYCFARPLHGARAPDATLSRDRLDEIFREAATLGAETLLVAGAEPLLRKDLPQIMGDAIQAGITPLLTTKHPVDRALALRLAQAGVRHISLSLDTLDGAESRRLIGSSAYPDQVRRSVGNLTRAGVAFSIQTVVTRLNPHALSRVAEFAARHGARVLQIVAFEPVMHPIASATNQDLSLAGPGILDEYAERLQRRYPTLQVERFEELGSGSRSGHDCDIGLSKLFFLPDGVVHRCYKLVHDDGLRGCDLNTTTVAAAWHDPGFRDTISPPRTAYARTACGPCARFDACHQTGRCIYRALIRHGRYEAPDRSCRHDQARVRRRHEPATR